MPDLRVLILADDPLARAGLAALLAEQPGCFVVGRASGAEDLGQVAAVHRPDVVLWDLGWNPGASLERLADGAEVLPPLAVLLPDAVVAGEA